MPTQARLLPLPELVAEQEHLASYIPTVLGPIEFRVWKRQLERIHEILGLGGVEHTFRDLSTGKQACCQRLSWQGLRCKVARTLTGESFRDFGCRLAESTLL